MNWGKYGKQNVVTNKDITINKISEQTRKIKFRDNMNLDIGLRFAEIVDEILMTADDFITAITNAINQSSKSLANYLMKQSRTGKSPYFQKKCLKLF